MITQKDIAKSANISVAMVELHIPNYQTIHDIPFEHKICDIKLLVENRIDHQRDLWCSKLTIPFEAIGLTQETIKHSRFVFARWYYHSVGRTTPEITTTQIFPKTAHYPKLWHIIE